MEIHLFSKVNIALIKFRWILKLWGVTIVRTKTIRTKITIETTTTIKTTEIINLLIRSIMIMAMLGMTITTNLNNITITSNMMHMEDKITAANSDWTRLFRTSLIYNIHSTIALSAILVGGAEWHKWAGLEERKKRQGNNVAIFQSHRALSPRSRMNQRSSSRPSRRSQAMSSTSPSIQKLPLTWSVPLTQPTWWSHSAWWLISTNASSNLKMPSIFQCVPMIHATISTPHRLRPTFWYAIREVFS